MPTVNVLDRRPCKSPHLVFRKQGDRVLVYNSATDQMYLLWPTAAEILKQCDGTRSAADVAAAVFPEEQLVARGSDEVARFFGQLEKRSLVSWPAGEGVG
jgi:Coenzyme PQQ synthesis protein D (PqqD)